MVTFPGHPSENPHDIEEVTRTGRTVTTIEGPPSTVAPEKFLRPAGLEPAPPAPAPPFGLSTASCQ
jgi:hypothetical protein